MKRFVAAMALFAACLLICGCQAEERTLIGEKCLPCHSIQELEGWSFDEGQWNQEILEMEGTYGVQLTEEEREAISKYLAD